MTRNELLAELVAQGENFSSWARARGYNDATVRQTVRRWVAGGRGVPARGLSRQIVRDLAESAGVTPDELCGRSAA